MRIRQIQPIIFTGILSLTLLMGCVIDNSMILNSKTTEEKKAEVKVLLLKKGEEIISKATSANNVSIKEVNILVYNISGTLINNEYFRSTSNLSITTSTGYKTIVAIANAGNIDFSCYTTLASVREAISMNMVNGTNDIIMAGEVNANLVKGGSVSVTLTRLISKVTVVFDKSSISAGTLINIKSIELKNVANQCKYLLKNTVNSYSHISIAGDNLNDNLEPSSHSEATPLYLFENMQGTIICGGGEKDKNPGAAQPYCSYVEISADYTTPAKIGTIKYRFYLGNNIYDNFDVERNTWYQLNVRFTGSGINEVSWRIDTSNLIDVTYNISAVASPLNGGTVSGAGEYIYGSTPSLYASPAANYIFIGWTPSICAVHNNMVYTANFQYIDPNISVTGVSLSKFNLNLDIGNTENLTATVIPSNATNKSITWSTSNPNIATVDANGTVTAVNPGTADISVTTKDGGYKSTCNVTVYMTVDLYFYFYRTAKLSYKSGVDSYWYLCESMSDDVYVKATGGNSIAGSLSYTINWAHNPSSGFSPPAPSSGTKFISISSTLNTLLESGTAWGDERDLDIVYPVINITGYSPTETSSPPVRIRINQSLNTYYLNEIGR